MDPPDLSQHPPQPLEIVGHAIERHRLLQEYQGREVHYRGDGYPVGYVEGQPLPPPPEEVSAENLALKARIAELEASAKRTNEMLERLLKAQEAANAREAPPAPSATPEPPRVPPRGK